MFRLLGPVEVRTAAGPERRGFLAPALVRLGIERPRALEDLAGARLDLDEPRHALDTAWQAVSADPRERLMYRPYAGASSRTGPAGESAGRRT